MFKKLGPLVAVFALISTLVPGATPVATAAAKGCSQATTGGEWRSFGHDLMNSRFQPEEKKLTPDTATLMMPKWTFSIAAAGGAGNFQSTPVIADGCMYMGTNSGWIFAINADTGELVWKTSLTASPLLAGLSGGVFSLAVEDGRVYANVSANGSPYATALDQDTGKVLWKTIVAKEDGSYTNSSVALIEGMLFIGISGPEDVDADVRHPGGFALLDPDNGRTITRVYTINKDDDAKGLKGASFWGTPVYDPKTGFMFDGTGQPANKAKEASLSNALVKVDMDRKHSTFARIVDYYHGDYDEGADLDFGGSPTAFKDKKGNLLIGAIQKSGRYHAVYADNMEQAWWARLGDPLALGNAGTGATDGKSVFIAASGQTDVEAREPNPGYLYSLNSTDGAVNWKTPVANGVDYHLISTAGGIVYIVTTHGLLLGLNAADGLPVVARSLSVDAHEPCVNLSSGAIVARNSVYAVCDVAANGLGYIVAYGI